MVKSYVPRATRTKVCVVVVNFGEAIQPTVSSRITIRRLTTEYQWHHTCVGTQLLARADCTKDGHVLNAEPISFFLFWEFEMRLEGDQSCLASARWCRHLESSLYLMWKDKREHTKTALEQKRWGHSKSTAVWILNSFSLRLSDPSLLTMGSLKTALKYFNKFLLFLLKIAWQGVNKF